MSATHIVFLRAVNVGGTGKLPMAELKALALELGFQNPRTYIASGNLLFESDLSAEAAGARLEARLAAYAGKPVGVLMRSPAELEALLAANPFSEGLPNQVLVTLLSAPPVEALRAHGQQDEAWQLMGRELWVHYPSGVGRSMLRISGVEAGTARNLNTLRAVLAQCAAG
ncbi:uncharacterized protein (DUF1697 family) [Inhella inkyongensis]|uniref:Uncharacterized protein (DUF1697 family) n=1 Tax=Inhella inkyongensis TaxID=392593 RepID=A0A840S670_9BURK|nr:DUF1697 domain-containing protein [Inhella inkyongensis]MBB5205193.1 uncharacterized protein (DUF1697 family) [Inhella inkyongensis]